MKTNPLWFNKFLVEGMFFLACCPFVIFQTFSLTFLYFLFLCRVRRKLFLCLLHEITRLPLGKKKKERKGYVNEQLGGFQFGEIYLS